MGCQLYIWEPGDGRCRCKGGTDEGNLLFTGPVFETPLEAYQDFAKSDQRWRLHAIGQLFFIRDLDTNVVSHLHSAVPKHVR